MTDGGLRGNQKLKIVVASSVTRQMHHDGWARRALTKDPAPVGGWFAGTVASDTGVGHNASRHYLKFIWMIISISIVIIINL